MSNVLSILVSLTALHGSVTYYNDGVFDAVVANRLRWGHIEPCPDCVGVIAVLDCARLGERAYLRVPDRADLIGPLLIVDCAARQDYARLQRRGLIAEVDAPLARELGMWRRGPLYGADLYIGEPQIPVSPRAEVRALEVLQ
jgi:hypothetical protein